MKLRDFKLQEDVRFEDPDHEVTHARGLSARGVRSDTLRFFDGNGTMHFAAGGAVVVPFELELHTAFGPFIRSRDPKTTFFSMVEQLYPDKVPCRIDVGVRVDVHPSAVIGRDGFGYHNGRRIPHIGHVWIGNDVEIGAHTCIDRGTLEETTIGARTKIDNLVHIAHNVRIGTDCQIVAGAVIGGSAVIGDRVFIGMGALIKNKITIGNDAVIGMGAVVTKDVPAGETWVGNPARKLEK